MSDTKCRLTRDGKTRNSGVSVPRRPPAGAFAGAARLGVAPSNPATNVTVVRTPASLALPDLWADVVTAWVVEQCRAGRSVATQDGHVIAVSDSDPTDVRFMHDEYESFAEEMRRRGVSESDLRDFRRKLHGARRTDLRATHRVRTNTWAVSPRPGTRVTQRRPSRTRHLGGQRRTSRRARARSPGRSTDDPSPSEPPLDARAPARAVEECPRSALRRVPRGMRSYRRARSAPNARGVRDALRLSPESER